MVIRVRIDTKVELISGAGWAIGFLISSAAGALRRFRRERLRGLRAASGRVRQRLFQKFGNGVVLRSICGGRLRGRRGIFLVGSFFWGVLLTAGGLRVVSAGAAGRGRRIVAAAFAVVFRIGGPSG